jgi:hypothetical protein
MDERQILSRIASLEHQAKRIRQAAGFLTILLIGTIVFQSLEIRRLENPQRLRVRELAVVDEHGTERVLIAAPLPDPIIAGQRRKRDGAVSGIAIADATGTERGGYVTGDGYANALLTLDAQGFQTALLLAEPDGATMFRIWNRDKGSVTSGVSDAPFLNVKRDGKPLFVAPVDNPQSRDTRPMFR